MLIRGRTRAQYRKAQLTAKHNADAAKLKERELLFSNLHSGTGSSTPSSTHRRRAGINESEIVTQASSDVTAALRRTHALLSSELSRSRFAQETLEQSTAALADLGESYADLNSLLANSRTLVTTLLKSQKSDTWYLETTFYILVSTVIWLVFRRWLYGPISWFILWPAKILIRVLFALVPVSASAAGSSVLTSLVVKPSATGGIPTRQPGQNFVRAVGGGGRAYYAPNPEFDPSAEESLSRTVGRMAEQAQAESNSKTEEQGKQEEEEVHPQLRKKVQEEEGPVVRGDGTVLPDRGERPRNPKKKMWVEGGEGKVAEEEGGQRERERDEL